MELNRCKVESNSKSKLVAGKTERNNLGNQSNPERNILGKQRKPVRNVLGRPEKGR